jgi:hypothetical protein
MWEAQSKFRSGEATKARRCWYGVKKLASPIEARINYVIARIATSSRACQDCVGDAVAFRPRAGLSPLCLNNPTDLFSARGVDAG